jgi:UDP-glucuronate decarboxylase
MNILEEDIMHIVESTLIDWKLFSNKLVMITGGTGLIGKILTESLIMCNEIYNYNIGVLLPVRDIKKAMEIYSKRVFDQVEVVEIDLTKIHAVKENVDIIIHCAAPTQSAYFMEYPVETIRAIVQGTESIMEYARKRMCKNIVYLSSMEVFGQQFQEILYEPDLGQLSLTSLRSCYPEAKRMTELMCYSYSKEYDIPVKIARLAQTFGPGVSLNDNRVFIQFCKAIQNKNDIILHTTGESIINYCYTTDAILGIYRIIQAGKSGETYSVVNDDDKITIYEIAKWMIDTYGKREQTIRFDFREETKYASQNHSKLSNDKLKTLGWEPEYSIKQGYHRLLQYFGAI